MRIFQNAIDLVAPRRCVVEAVRCDGDSIQVEDDRFAPPGSAVVWVVGGGKASAAMASGLHARLGGHWSVRGLVNVPASQAGSFGDIECLAARPDGVNEPTLAAVEGTRRMRSIIRAARPDDLVIALISGGGSALLCDPRPPVTLDDKIAVTRHLSAAGVDIEQINVVRRAISNVKGGGLIAGCVAQHLTLVLSDVLGDPLGIDRLGTHRHARRWRGNSPTTSH